ncbi:ELKS/Rab6-interacting/CAST family protein [Shewanella pneumatophori]|uniref:ELKS/Rab6-interacting/CAST family protein n=1 Tax=Shewanella pneumatophori TaxID=314092 RepID=A0A9X1ZN21_9GAMM|nr:ELKS/Rab6-interacting/CAST family protein [Shewanella pneumatophori]MCL1138681.1 ELKS/Rab6-interacting/CAST family protein [Shewanella pneumatophori]
MGPFTIAAIAIVAVFLLKAYKEYNKQKGRIDADELVQVNKELKELKERVMTLEKIVTDKSYQLHDEIDKL